MKTRDLTAASIGNILEWFDFGLFIYLAPILGSQFFHFSDPKLATLAAFDVFFTGYICRPIGGILFGFLGDTKGRAKSLRSSVLMMSIAILAVGLLPGYQTIGILSPILFILIRMLQGISAGGEYCGIMIYLAESADHKNKGFITSFAGSGANLGFLLASVSIILLNYFIPEHELSAWVFRIPFVFLGFLGLLIFIFRLNLSETAAYQYLKSKHLAKQKPLLTALKYAPKSLLKIFSLTCLSSTFYIILFGYMPTYLTQFSGVSTLTAFTIQSVLLFLMLFFIPLGGMLGDRFGRKNILLINSITILFFALPFFYLLNSQNIIFIVLALLFTTLQSSLDQGNNLCAFVENCPIDVRYSGIGFAYNTGNALFGGTTPLVMSTVIAVYGPIIPAYYLMACALVSFLGILTLLPKNKSEEFSLFVPKK